MISLNDGSEIVGQSSNPFGSPGNPARAGVDQGKIHVPARGLPCGGRDHATLGQPVRRGRVGGHALSDRKVPCAALREPAGNLESVKRLVRHASR